MGDRARAGGDEEEMKEDMGLWKLSDVFFWVGGGAAG